jgi:DNA-binding response OmpR family regulator
MLSRRQKGRQMPHQISPTLPAASSAALRHARPVQPLAGLTILAVEDSRFASEALRLLCLRSDARLRRADSLDQADRHLSVYRPDIVIIDLGLPDGDGADLIRRLARRRCPGLVVLGTSGDPAGHRAALAAGAAGFLPKPIPSLAQFQAVLLGHLRAAPHLAQDIGWGPLHPDRIALHDDLLRAANLLRTAHDARSRHYVASFLGSLARSAQDPDLEQAAAQAADTALALPQLAALVAARLAATPPAFGPPDSAIPLSRPAG